MPLGALCPHCRAEIERRAAKWANGVSAVTTLAMAAYTFARMPWGNSTAVRVGIAGVVVWFVLVNMVVRRVLRQWTG